MKENAFNVQLKFIFASASAYAPRKWNELITFNLSGHSKSSYPIFIVALQ